MAWVVWWQGVGQVVREGQVTLGYLLSRESTSGGHCEVGGGSGELADGGAEGVAVGVVGEVWGGGRLKKQVMSWGRETKHEKH